MPTTLTACPNQMTPTFGTTILHAIEIQPVKFGIIGFRHARAVRICHPACVAVGSRKGCYFRGARTIHYLDTYDGSMVAGKCGQQRPSEVERSRNRPLPLPVALS